MAHSRWAEACGIAPVAASGALLDRSEARYESAPMKVDGKHTRTIWLEPDGWSVGAIDQTRLPHRFETTRLTTVADAARAIATMQVRGAPLIGATAAYGVALALRADSSDAGLTRAYAELRAARPTAI